MPKVLVRNCLLLTDVVSWFNHLSTYSVFVAHSAWELKASNRVTERLISTKWALRFVALLLFRNGHPLNEIMAPKLLCSCCCDIDTGHQSRAGTIYCKLNERNVPSSASKIPAVLRNSSNISLMFWVVYLCKSYLRVVPSMSICSCLCASWLGKWVIASAVFNYLSLSLVLHLPRS